MTDQSITHPGHPIADLSRRLLNRRARQRRRRDTTSLLELDDHILNDIGFTREDVARAARAPLILDAPTELRRLSASRR